MPKLQIKVSSCNSERGTVFSAEFGIFHSTIKIKCTKIAQIRGLVYSVYYWFDRLHCCLLVIQIHFNNTFKNKLTTYLENEPRHVISNNLVF